MKLKSIIFVLVLLVFIVNSCKKETELLDNGNKIEFGNTTNDPLSKYYAVISTELISAGGNNISKVRHCWDTMSINF